MKLLRISAAFALYCALATAPIFAFSQSIDRSITPYAVAQATPAPAPVAVPAPSAGTTITTTAPVNSDTTVSVGTIAGQVLTWILAAFAVPIGGFVVLVLSKFAAGVGFSLDDARRARLQEIVVTGLHAGAAVLTRNFDGKIPINLKSTLLANTVRYVQEHGADTLKALGLDPTSPEAVAAIQARAERALADPAVPVAVSPAPTVPRA